MTVAIDKEFVLRELLDEIGEDNTNDYRYMVLLVDVLRPSSAANTDEASDNLKLFTHLLRQHHNYCSSFKKYLLEVFASRNSIRAFTELGILSSAGFFTETVRKVTYKVLPPAYNEKDLMKLLHEIFRKDDDYIWINNIPAANWARLFSTLDYKEPHLLEIGHPTLNQLLNSILVLSQRITAIGLEPDVVEKMPEIELFISPFMVQSREISIYLKEYIKDGFNRTAENDDYKHILVMLNQCEEYVEDIRKNKTKFGTSLRLTYSLVRVTQNIERLRMLLKLVHLTEEKYPNEDEATFFNQLIRAENKKYSISEHFSQNLRYLAFQITEHTGKTGEKYITTTRKEYWKMLKTAMGGGVIVGFLVIIKTVIYKMSLSLFSRAFLFSMNYSFGFILIHLTHSTLATKQPAMTASRFASALDVKGPKEDVIGNLVELIVRLSRSQFIAFVGNIIIAFPVGFGVAYLIEYFTGTPFISDELALKTLKDIHPTESLAIFHAAIAGVFLFLSGVISGYYDNLSVYRKIPQRLCQQPLLQKIMSQERLERFSKYIEYNLGALAGNFFFGIFLGSMGTIGIILGLPLDIRHVTFSSGNFGLALAALKEPVSDYALIVTSIGVALIGLTNFLVSFGLTIIMAMKSRTVSFKESRLLIRLLILRFMSTPLDFFYAPKEKREKVDPPSEEEEPDIEEIATEEEEENKKSS